MNLISIYNKISSSCQNDVYSIQNPQINNNIPVEGLKPIFI